jgi:uncharacterized HAD superfamily protein
MKQHNYKQYIEQHKYKKYIEQHKYKQYIEQNKYKKIYRTTKITKEQHKLQLIWKSAGRAPSFRILPWHLPYN